MRRTLLIFDYKNLDEETKKELTKASKYLEKELYIDHHYHNSMRFLKILAAELEKQEIKSDIYYKIASVQNILDNEILSGKRNAVNCQIFDVYLECTYHKDYRNAMKMLKIYQKTNNTDFIKLHLASLYIRIFQLDKAEKLLEEVETTQGENPLYYTTLLDLLYRKKEYEKVIGLLPIIEKYDGYTFHIPYLRIAKSFLRMGQEKEAKEIYDTIAQTKKGILSEQLLEKAKEEAMHEDMIVYPTRNECVISYQIAMDEKNYEEAIYYLEKVIELSCDKYFLCKSTEKLKELKKLTKTN